MLESEHAQLQALRTSLTAAATFGTGRRPFALPEVTGALADALVQLDPALGEHALLSAAAVVTSYVGAGYQPSHTPLSTTVEPAAADPRQPCPRMAIQHLQAMLSGDYRAALAEWLAALSATGRRVPAWLLPDLLNAGRQIPALHSLIRAAIGTHGQWIAAQNQEWQYASVPPATNSSSAADRWQTGTRAMRLALLEATRRATPDGARALLASTWASEKAGDRAAFLEVLGITLSMADEPFLEAALDDRSRDVRRTAAELLARLPDSRLVERMIVRVTPLLRWIPPVGAQLFRLIRGKPGSIEIALPTACDTSMARDGVDRTPPATPHAAGERTGWLFQMLRTIPPRIWAQRWQATPEDILLAAQEHPEQRTMLMQAWADAACFSNDAAWAAALLRLAPEQRALLAVLPAAQQEALLLDMLTSSSTAKSRAAVLTLLSATQHQWSMALSRAALGLLLQSFERSSELPHHALVQLLHEIGYRMSPALLPEILAVRLREEAAHERWQRATERMLSTLHFRSEMHAALNG